MCGRFTQKDTKASFTENIYGYPKSAHALPKRHNIKPTQEVSVIISEDGAEPQLAEARWWFQKEGAKEFSTEYSTFNARADKVESSFLFKHALAHQRCLVPVSSFYEWSKKGMPPTEIYLPDEKPFALAGLFSHWLDGGTESYSFTIITTEPNDFMKRIHNRMPVVLSDVKTQRKWLETGGTNLLIPFAHRLEGVQLEDSIEKIYE